MDRFVGLNVSVRTMLIRVMDGAARVLQVEPGLKADPVPSRPCPAVLRATIVVLALEAGPLSQRLCGGPGSAGYPAFSVETRHLKAVLPELLPVSWTAG